MRIDYVGILVGQLEMLNVVLRRERGIFWVVENAHVRDIASDEICRAERGKLVRYGPIDGRTTRRY